MLALRNDPAHRDLEHGELVSQLMSGERRLSNVGVSVVLTVNIDDKDYLILARRQTKEGPRLMLPSGYVDAYQDADESLRSPALLTEQALKELNEEVIATDGEQITRGRIFESAISAMLATELKIIEPPGADTGLLPALLRPAYPEFSERYTDDNPYEIHRGDFPRCVRSLCNAPAVMVDGQPTDFRFHVDIPNASGQVVAAYRITLPEQSELSLLHAETAPDKDADKKNGVAGHLKEVLDPRGLIVAELDDQGEMTGKLFRVQQGRVVPAGEDEFPPDSTRFSEAFSRPVVGLLAPAVAGDVPWSAYFHESD